jgi:patatin-like phospholipase/acyl hydrolase
MPYRILTIDGGGIRGLLTAILLQRLEEEHPGFLDQIDLFAGTSTGGLLALGLAAGFTPTKARELYEEKGTFVFADSFWDNLTDLGTAIGAQYATDNLKQVLAEQFGERTLADLHKKVLISAFEMDNKATAPGTVRTWKAKFFHNFPGEDSDGDQLVVDVGVRTSAAPIYFPIYQGYVDGGVVAANPSMCALAQALHPPTGGQALGDIALLSLGTGRTPRYVSVTHGDWGWAQWINDLNILGVMMDGSSGLADYQCRQVLGGRYHRLDPTLPRHVTMDDVREIPLLQEIAAGADLSDTVAWLQEHFDA